MSFSKAVQKLEIEGQKEWTEAYNLYCKRCSVNKKMLKALKARADEQAEYLLLKQEKEFKQQCKEFSKASDRWATQQIQHKLKMRGVKDASLSASELAKILDINLVTTGKQLTELEKQQSIIRNTDPEKLEAMIKWAKEHPPATTKQEAEPESERGNAWSLGEDDEI